MIHYKIAVIGGGPAGMMAAINASKNSNKVILIEKTNSLGKKLLLTGGGRCNIANSIPMNEQLNKVSNKNFLKHSFYTLNNENLLNIFRTKGLDFKEEDKKYFPITDDSKSVLKILKDYLNELKVKILLNSNINNVKKESDNFVITTDNISISAEKLIIATGGISYPKTGSTGYGYKIATYFGHEIVNLKPGLVPLKVVNENLIKKLSGITFENVKVSFKSVHNKKRSEKTIKTKGNVLITHNSLSGPAILDISNIIGDFIDYDLKDENNYLFNDIFILIDLIPRLSYEELNNKIIKDSQIHGRKKIKNYMKYYIPNRFINHFLNVSNVLGNITMSNLTKKDKNKIITNLKYFKIKVIGFMPKESAMITNGGVSLNKINPKTMESKLINNLYFAGEILDVHGPTGGYNLQIAFSTGYLAGKTI